MKAFDRLKSEILDRESFDTNLEDYFALEPDKADTFTPDALKSEGIARELRSEVSGLFKRLKSDKNNFRLTPLDSYLTLENNIGNGYGKLELPAPRRQDTMNIESQEKDISANINKPFEKGVKCKFCGKTNSIKKGKRNGVQRYQCKSCERYFLDNDSFPRTRINKNVIRFALDIYFEGLSMRKVVRQIKKIWSLEIHASTVYRWIERYTPLVEEYLKQFHPQAVGHEWHNDETMISVAGQKVYYWDLIDRETKFLLSGFNAGRHRGVREARRMYREAKELAQGHPDAVYCDRNPSYERAFHGVFWNHRVGFYNKIGIRSKINTNNAIERFHSTLKDRLKPMRGMQNPKAVLDGFRIHYNYLRPHQSLEGKTPAQAGGIDLPFEDGWGDLIDWSYQYQNGNTVKSRPPKHWQHKFHRSKWSERWNN